MATIIFLTPERTREAAAFAARLQADQTQQIAYLGESAAEIEAAMRGFEASDGKRVIAAIEGERIVGLMGVDADEESQRAWLYGPLVDYPEWDDVADKLYAEAKILGSIPEWVDDEELFVDSANRQVERFAGRHGFIPGTPQASLRLGREAYNEPIPISDNVPFQISELSEDQQQAFAALHKSIFPQTYYSGRQIIERLGMRDKVFVAVQDDVLIGYIYAKIEPEASNGYIDFLGVVDNSRRQGSGKALIQTAVNWLFTLEDIDEVTLTVDGRNAGAIALYNAARFQHLQTLQAYRKRDTK